MSYSDYQDFTNSNLTSFIGALVDTYSRLNWAINNPVSARKYCVLQI